MIRMDRVNSFLLTVKKEKFSSKICLSGDQHTFHQYFRKSSLTVQTKGKCKEGERGGSKKIQRNWAERISSIFLKKFTNVSQGTLWRDKI